MKIGSIKYIWLYLYVVYILVSSFYFFLSGSKLVLYKKVVNFVKVFYKYGNSVLLVNIIIVFIGEVLFLECF